MRPHYSQSSFRRLLLKIIFVHIIWGFFQLSSDVRSKNPDECLHVKGFFATLTMFSYFSFIISFSSDTNVTLSTQRNWVTHLHTAANTINRRYLLGNSELIKRYFHWLLNICKGFSVNASFTIIYGNDIGNLSKLPPKTSLLNKSLTVVGKECFVF